MTTEAKQAVAPGPERRAPVEMLRVVQPAPRRTMLLVVIGLAVEIAIMYGRSIGNGLVGDDWTLLYFGNHGVAFALAWEGVYHFDPITQLFIMMLFQAFGPQPLIFHGIAFLFFWLDAVLLLLLARRITGKLSIGALAGALFVAFGNQFEAVI